MVINKLCSLAFAAALLAGCSGVEIKAEYPNQSKTQAVGKTASLSPKSGDVAGNKVSAKSAFHDEHYGQKTEDYLWPMAEASTVLEKYKQGEIGEAVDKDGKPVVFAVLAEYSSAGNKRCKKYFVNLDLHLACYNPHWYPVRSFEE